MVDPGDVARPGDPLGVERAGDDEALGRHAPRRLDQEPLELGLPVVAVGAEVAQVPARLQRLRPVEALVDRAVERPRQRGAVGLLEVPPGRAAREGEVEVEARDQVRRQVLEVRRASLARVTGVSMS